MLTTIFFLDRIWGNVIGTLCNGFVLNRQFQKRKQWCLIPWVIWRSKAAIVLCLSAMTWPSVFKAQELLCLATICTQERNLHVTFKSWACWTFIWNTSKSIKHILLLKCHIMQFRITRKQCLCLQTRCSLQYSHFIYIFVNLASWYIFK